MHCATTQTAAIHTTFHRALTQQGVGGRAKLLRNRMIRRVMALCLLVLGLSMIHVWSRVQVFQLRYEITGLQKEVDDLQQQFNRTQMTGMALKSPDRLERVAKEELGLQLPMPGQVVFVRESTHGEQQVDAIADGAGSTTPAGE